MAKPVPLCRAIGIESENLSTQEIILLEIELYSLLIFLLKDEYQKEHQQYYRLTKVVIDEESAMLNLNVMRKIIFEIINSNEYTLEGVATYTYTCIEVIQNIIVGKTEPTISLALRIMELHRSVRPDLYETILEKIKKELTGIR